MKKIRVMILCMTLVLLMAACAKEDEEPLKSGTYTLQNVERDVPGDFTITIYEDGTFQHYETPISSYIGAGHYSIEGDVVTLKEDVDGCTGNINYYKIIDNELSFISEDSANYHFVPLKEGARFVWTG